MLRQPRGELKSALPILIEALWKQAGSPRIEERDLLSRGAISDDLRRLFIEARENLRASAERSVDETALRAQVECWCRVLRSEPILASWAKEEVLDFVRALTNRLAFSDLESDYLVFLAIPNDGIVGPIPIEPSTRALRARRLLRRGQPSAGLLWQSRGQEI